MFKFKRYLNKPHFYLFIGFIYLEVARQIDGFMASFRPRVSTNKCLSCCYSLFGKRASRIYDKNKLNGEQPPQNVTVQAKDVYKWEVYVDQSKTSLEKGGSATLDAFYGLAPQCVKVVPAILPKTKAKPPVIRCISLAPNQVSFDVTNVDSVDKVHRVLTKHMQLKDISLAASECLKWKYKGNGHLEAGKVSLAIMAYDNALEIGVASQEGIIRLMRATAYLQRAASHKARLKDSVNKLIGMVPDMSNLQSAYEATMLSPALTNAVFRKVLEETNEQELQFRKTQYWHGLYQYALLQAAQDSLRASKLLPNYATSWLRAGEILSELWKLNESAKYFEKAVELDKSLEKSIGPVVERLRTRQKMLERARAYGWSEDTLRLALDVAR